MTVVNFRITSEARVTNGPAQPRMNELSWQRRLLACVLTIGAAALARYHRNMRPPLLFPLAIALLCLTGCGYHTLGAATHLPPDVKTISVPEFGNHTVVNGTARAMTEAVIREFMARTSFKVTPSDKPGADAVLHGTILQEAVRPLTYNLQTQQSSSFLITVVASVTLTDSDGKVLYRNNNYTFRKQYQSTTNLPTFVEEDPAAIERLSRDFASQLVADVLESF